jgi:ribose 5-phosphate isomerase B
MRVAIGSDHAGYDLKCELAACLEQLGHEVVDMGTHNSDPVDYPDFAEAVSREVVGGGADRGIVICGSGVGASIAANKVPGIRAGTCHDTYSAHQGVEHDDMNILVVGARIIGVELAKEILRAFLAAEFSKEDRHRRRLGKVMDIERRYTRGGR